MSDDVAERLVGKEVKPVAETMYSCKTCGKVTTDQGHLCAPKEIKRAYSCDYCGVTSTNPRHICKPKVAKVKYTCDTCGRVAVDETFLCNPKEIT